MFGVIHAFQMLPVLRLAGDMSHIGCVAAVEEEGDEQDQNREHDAIAHTPDKHRYIQEGDMMVAVFSRFDMELVHVKRGCTLHHRFGDWPHELFLAGVPWGATVSTKSVNLKQVKTRRMGKKSRSASMANTVAWLTCLRVTCELWARVIPHRTQILYPPICSSVVGLLNIKPGSIVLESGTGSAALTFHFVRATQPKGFVCTFEFNESRVQAARRDLHEWHGIPRENVQVFHRDIVNCGFPQEEFSGLADAVFLDLPSPWAAAPSAIHCLRSGGRLCSFSPCIEQVSRFLKSVEEFNAQSSDTYAHDIHTIEVVDTAMRYVRTLQFSWDESKGAFYPKTYDINVPETHQPGHTGFLSFCTIVRSADTS